MTKLLSRGCNSKHGSAKRATQIGLKEYIHMYFVHFYARQTSIKLNRPKGALQTRRNR